ncbi:Atrial natriuretic peptide receptor 1 [Folsomia candida]|uniref:Atrial natriuretic peptide receptor 1 n=1 Tax=Folsomia candida TaxID=158441 RepID=A0A226DH74_FOLCA|nr:Atrial natriuretic peptide receptor 1 [Folsomia candida]
MSWLPWELVIFIVVTIVMGKSAPFPGLTSVHFPRRNNDSKISAFRQGHNLYGDDDLVTLQNDEPRKLVKIGVLAPEGAVSPMEHYSMSKVLPSIMLAVRSDRISSLLPGYRFEINHRNTNCSSTLGPLAAFEFYINKTADVFLGPMCDYVIAPVARYAGHWGIPVLTAGAQADAFRHKHDQYPTLTRMAGSYALVGEAFHAILARFGWRHVALFYHNHAVGSGKGHSLCHFSLGTIYSALNNTPVHRSFDETQEHFNFHDALRSIAATARIVVLCASPRKVRDILLAAEELKMVSSGEYVFFNVELFTNLQKGYKPWENRNDTAERNLRARRAYEAVLTVTVRPPPDSEEYNSFDTMVKEKAISKFNFSYGDEPVNPIVTAFYDAVILYAIALNETLKNGGNITNGSEITRRMRGKTFQGITGNVSIDENGDRNADYSLLDMDPVTGAFHVVAHYSGRTKSIIDVEGTKIHWAGNRATWPPDTPKCGFDGTGCPTMPRYVIVVIVLSSALVIMLISFFFIYRLVSHGGGSSWEEDFTCVIRGRN